MVFFKCAVLLTGVALAALQAIPLLSIPPAQPPSIPNVTPIISPHVTPVGPLFLPPPVPPIDPAALTADSDLIVVGHVDQATHPGDAQQITVMGGNGIVIVKQVIKGELKGKNVVYPGSPSAGDVNRPLDQDGAQHIYFFKFRDGHFEWTDPYHRYVDVPFSTPIAPPRGAAPLDIIATQLVNIFAISEQDAAYRKFPTPNDFSNGRYCWTRRFNGRPISECSELVTTLAERAYEAAFGVVQHIPYRYRQYALAQAARRGVSPTGKMLAVALMIQAGDISTLADYENDLLVLQPHDRPFVAGALAAALDGIRPAQAALPVYKIAARSPVLAIRLHAVDDLIRVKTALALQVLDQALENSDGGMRMQMIGHICGINFMHAPLCDPVSANGLAGLASPASLPVFEAQIGRHLSLSH